MNDFGIIGLGVMGRNLGRNFARNGYRIGGYDLSADQRTAFAADDNALTSYSELDEFTASLELPRKIIVLVPSSAVDSVLKGLIPHLQDNDIVVDMGNSYFKDTNRRHQELAQHHIHFVGSGVSGGEYGALNGPSMMPGGDKAAYEEIAPALERIAAYADGEPCVNYMGKESAGHYVKMVHNGIEYAIMQIIAEAYHLLKTTLQLDNSALHKVFSDWNSGELSSYLMEITAAIFAKIDDETQQPLIDIILDEAKQKGTGRWTSESALELGVPTPTINAAVEARIISGLKQERVYASQDYTAPAPPTITDKAKFIEQVRQAVYASIVCAYTQGITLIQTASQEYDYEVNMVTVLKVWRAGCIIRADLLNDLTQVYVSEPGLPNTMLAVNFKQKLADYAPAWRKTLSIALESGAFVPAMSSALTYYTAYHSARLPANLIQAQRDYFGAHTYRRLDKDGSFHTEWQD